jgi:DNA-binding response OmpR family regulator
MARKLLLADDSITIQKVVELILSEEDFDIQSVSNGEDALAVMDSFLPDIVMADIEMPKVNGYQLCEKIRQNPATANVPVVLLAGAFEPIDSELAQQVGANDSVVKPFESQELISKINTVLAASAEGGAVAEEPGLEAVELAEDTDILIEAEPAVEAVEAPAGDEDLWTLEETPDMPEVTEEAVTAEPAVSPDESATEEILTHEPEVAEVAAISEPSREVAPKKVVMPSDEELRKIFEKTVNERVSDFLSALDIKESLMASLMPVMKDSVEKILWEIAPEMVEKMLKEIVQGSVTSLTKEVEKVIWETVPDLANTIITKEIEKIKSEL